MKKGQTQIGLKITLRIDRLYYSVINYIILLCVYINSFQLLTIFKYITTELKIVLLSLSLDCGLLSAFYILLRRQSDESDLELSLRWKETIG